MQGYWLTYTAMKTQQFKFDGLDDGKYKIHIEADGKDRDIDVEIAGKSLNLDFIEF